MPVKQVIVIRKDLKMRRGKEIAQGSHASMAILLDFVKSGKTVNDFDECEKEWYLGRFRKICLYVNSEKELLEVYEKAKEKGLRVSKIIDAGLTEFDGVPTLTCIAIGPNYDDDINPVTETLPLY
jgi:PTH2 family peptidyl-tRNA hydrolase